MYTDKYSRSPERSRNKKRRHHEDSSKTTSLCEHRHRRSPFGHNQRRRPVSPPTSHKYPPPIIYHQQQNETVAASDGNDSVRVEHMPIELGSLLGGKYRIIKLLGDGTFGRVVQCEYKGEIFAVKIIKPVERYIYSAKIQRDIIKRINERDPDDEQGIVRYVRSFYEGRHFCMVFRPLGQSLYDFLKMNKFQGFSHKLTQSFFKQILKSVGFLHKIGYTHTDLKPENILLEKPDFYEVHQDGPDQKYYAPCSDKIRIIDFGGATKYDYFHSEIINTRQYRSPEVILQCAKWNQISDMWSIGCIVVELASGVQLFPTREDEEQLAMIEKNCGRYPRWMIQNIPKHSHLRRLFQDGVINQDRVRTLEYVVKTKILEELLPRQRELVNLLRKCLQIDPNVRINCKQALKHPFFQLDFS